MKKVIAFITAIAVAVTCVSCNPNSQPKTNGYVESAKKYGYYHIFNVSYGMLFEECLDALGVTEDEVKVLTPTDLGNEPNDLSQKGLMIDTILYDRDVKAIFIFYEEVVESGYEVGLNEIRITFNSPIDYMELVSKVQSDLEDRGITNEIEGNFSGGISFFNTKTYESIEDEEIRNNVADLSNKMFYDWIPDKTGVKPMNEGRLDSISIITYPDTQEVFYLNIYSMIATVIGIVTNRY